MSQTTFVLIDKTESTKSSHARTTKITHQDGLGYFTAELDNGGRAVGLLDCERFDFPPTHEMYVAIGDVTSSEQAEALFDRAFTAYAQMCSRKGLSF